MENEKKNCLSLIEAGCQTYGHDHIKCSSTTEIKFGPWAHSVIIDQMVVIVNWTKSTGFRQTEKSHKQKQESRFVDHLFGDDPMYSALYLSAYVVMISLQVLDSNQLR